MMTPEQMRLLRLKNEYDMIQRLPENDVYSIKPSPGQQPPLVSSYDVTYNIPTYINDGRELQNRTVVRFQLTEDFPRSEPCIKVVEGAVPFHVHCYDSGSLSPGNFWNPSRWLYELFNFIGEMLQWQKNRINVHSCCSREAVQFYLANPDKFPTDNRPMPQPSPQ